MMNHRLPRREEPDGNRPVRLRRDTILLAGTGVEITGWMLIIIGITWNVPAAWIAGGAISLATLWILWMNRRYR